jgi:Uma2 family endonuclease
MTSPSRTSCFCGRAPTAIAQATPGRPTSSFFIEVSESSLAYDRSTKLALYAKFGVPEVWIVDLFGAAVEVCREPKGGAYASRERLPGGLLAPALVRGVTIDVARLLA